MKTDDDMWVNVPDMLKMLQVRGQSLLTSVGGTCFQSAGPIRNPKSKWYASIRSYPRTSYPGFCSGTGYITSWAVSRKLYEVSENVPFFHLEDVYIAICIRKLGMKLQAIPGFHNSRVALQPCVMRSPKVLTSHQVPTDFLLKTMAANCQ